MSCWAELYGTCNLIISIGELQEGVCKTRFYVYRSVSKYKWFDNGLFVASLILVTSMSAVNWNSSMEAC